MAVQLQPLDWAPSAVDEPGGEGLSLLLNDWEFCRSEWDSVSLPDLCLPLAVG